MLRNQNTIHLFYDKKNFNAVLAIKQAFREINYFSCCSTLRKDVLPVFTYFDMPKIQGIRKTQKPRKKPEKPKNKWKNPKTKLPMSFS
jgi:hypothetical protein